MDGRDSDQRTGTAGPALDLSLVPSGPVVDTAYQAILDATPAMIWVSGPDKAGIYFNRAWREFTGRALADELGAGWLASIHPDDAEAMAVCERAFVHRRPFSTELRIRRHDGTYHWVLDRGVPRFAESGEFLGFVGCLVDVSDRKQAEADLARVERGRDEVLAVLAHELRGPLTAIRCALDLDLQLGSSDPRVARARQVIARQTEQMTRLISDLIDTARVARGRMQLSLEVVDLAALVATVAGDHQPVVTDRGLSLSVHLAGTPLWLRADAGRLSQAFGNLLDNAIKFTDAPGTITITAGRHLPSAMLFTSISDTGAGLDAADRARLEAGEMLPGGARSGLGLGLPLVRELAELHGGCLEIASDGPGRGATFTLWLPPASPPPGGPTAS